VSISYLESIIKVGKDFELNINGAGLKEAINGYF
jgi:hypothetical protein